jgi:hypothetical protein
LEVPAAAAWRENRSAAPSRAAGAPAKNTRAFSSSSSGSSAVGSIIYPDDYIRDVLSSTRTIAMVGASPNWNRPSYFAMKYLQGSFCSLFLFYVSFVDRLM